MSKKDKRQKASDVFWKATLYLLKNSFDKVFPETEDLVVEVEKSGNGININK